MEILLADAGAKSEDEHRKKGQFTFTSERLLCILKTPFSPSSITIKVGSPIRPRPTPKSSHRLTNFQQGMCDITILIQTLGKKKTKRQRHARCLSCLSEFYPNLFTFEFEYSMLMLIQWKYVTWQKAHTWKQKIDGKRATQRAANWKSFYFFQSRTHVIEHENFLSQLSSGASEKGEEKWKLALKFFRFQVSRSGFSLCSAFSTARRLLNNLNSNCVPEYSTGLKLQSNWSLEHESLCCGGERRKMLYGLEKFKEFVSRREKVLGMLGKLSGLNFKLKKYLLLWLESVK